jgi:Predicted transcriptional regulator containing an HTH domain and an uncharacterized domain shared with the mammalian protein Schlafen
MAVPTNIKTLLSGSVVEWARIEFKETWDAEASLKTICAFANDIDNRGGGYIVIGVTEREGRPDSLLGVPAEKIDHYLKDMLNKCKRIQPEYLPIVEVADYKGKKFIVIWAPGGYLRPYSSPKSMAKGEKERIYYIRKMASTIAPSEEEKRDLYNLANNVPFDDRINHEADLTDLNLTLIQAYLKEIGSSLYEESKHMEFLDLCQNMNIINSLPEYIKPKNVGLMFFSLEPQKFFPYAQIDVVQFPDGLGGNKIIEKIFKGPLHQQLRDALLYIRNNILTEHVIKHPDRAEADRFFNYPYAAVEESLCNAAYHKGYDVREPIEVRVLPDRIEIVSHPGADRSITEEGLRTYRVFNRRYRNRRIGEFLKEMHLTEGRNTSFRKILNALEQNGSPKPVFETDPERLSFCTTLLIHPHFLHQEESRNNIVHSTDGQEESAQYEDKIKMLEKRIQELTK